MGKLLIFAVIFLPMLAAPFLYLLSARAALRDSLVQLVALLCAAASVLLAFLPASAAIPNFCMLGASFSSGSWRALLLALSGIAFFCSSLAAQDYFLGEERVGRYQAFFLVTFGATAGVFLANDLFTAYLFFECMSLSSWVWVAQNETDASRDAANLYLAISIIGGLVMLFGVLELYAALGDLSFDALLSASAGVTGRMRVAAVCVLFGFAAKAGLFPLHIWLPKAHPAAPAPASALLSGVLTKAGVFGAIVLRVTLLRFDAFFTALLLILGAITMLLGALLALITNDLKRALACSSLSQIGFITIGVALFSPSEAGSLAFSGALLHMLNHGMIKTVLFLTAGVLYNANHTLDLNRLRGAGRGNRFLTVCFLIGALSIAGVPLFSGYASKTLLHEGIKESMALYANARGWLSALEWTFLGAGGLTLAYMTKLFVRLFVEKPESGAAKRAQCGKKTTLAIGLPALMLLIGGLLPNVCMLPLVSEAVASAGIEPLFTFAFFSAGNLSGAAISLAFGIAVIFVFVRGVLTTRTGAYRELCPRFTLETCVYRPLITLIGYVGAFFCRVVYQLPLWLLQSVSMLLKLGAERRTQPKGDDHFAHYSRKYVKIGTISQTLAFELLLFGLGVASSLLYLLLG